MTNLIDYIDIISGGTPKTSNYSYWNGTIPWISVKDFACVNRYVLNTEKTITEKGLNNSATNLLYKNDIIISARGTVGKLALISKTMAFNQSCFGIRSKSTILNQLFLYYWLLENVKKLKNEANGGVFDTIIKTSFNTLVIDIPSIECQQHIVDTIGSIDDLIEHNNLLIDKLNSFIWLKFLKLKEAIDKNIVDNLIMKDLVNITTGKKNANAAVDNGQYAFFTCSLDDYKTDNYCFDCEAIIIAGNGAINVKYYKGKFDAYQRTYVITSNKYFFYCYCLYKDSINSLIAGSKGSVINFITLGMLQEINVKITNEFIHETFETECSILMNSICKLKDKNNQLEQLKKQYLNKFFG